MTELDLPIPGVRAVRLQEAHMEGILALMNREGWYYYDRHELERYVSLNQDCFTLFKDGRIAGSVFTTDYGNQAWIGNVVVAEDARGMGLATALITAVMDDLHENKGIRTFRLGSVPLAIGLYKRIGFHAESFTTAQEAELPLETAWEEGLLGGNLRVERLRARDLEAVAELDARHCKSRRLALLTRLHRDAVPGCRLCLKDRDRVAGFLMVRRRTASKEEGRFAEGPDHAYRLGPSCVLPEVGIEGFKALFQEAVPAVHEDVRRRGGRARMYVVFPKSPDRETIYEDTRELAKALGMDATMNLDVVFDEHDHLFGTERSAKGKAQWAYMSRMGFRQEYFEQVMSYTPGEPPGTPPARRIAWETRADPEGIFASATPGDKG